MRDRSAPPPIPVTGLTAGQVAVVDVIHFTGGLRAHRGPGGWRVGPIAGEQGLRSVGPYVDEQLSPLAAACGLLLFGVNEISLDDPKLPGSHWRPLLGQPALKFMPADSWGMVAWAAQQANDTSWASLARNLSISLRAAGLQLRNASNEYERQLVAALARGQAVSRGFSNTALMDLHLACHSTLAEMASARDYLAQAAALRVGAPRKIEALNRLVDWVAKPANAPARLDPLVQALRAALDPSADPWLADIGSYRNLFLHRQPLGADEHARFLRLQAREGLENLKVISMEMTKHEGSDATCEVLVRLVELNHKLLRLADFAVNLAPYAAEPPHFVAS